MSLHAQSVLQHGQQRRAFVVETGAAALRVATTYLAHWASGFVVSDDVTRYWQRSILDARMKRPGVLLRAIALRCDDAQKRLSDEFLKRTRADACPDDIAEEVGNGIFGG